MLLISLYYARLFHFVVLYLERFCTTRQQDLSTKTTLCNGQRLDKNNQWNVLSDVFLFGIKVDGGN